MLIKDTFAIFVPSMGENNIDQICDISQSLDEERNGMDSCVCKKDTDCDDSGYMRSRQLSSFRPYENTIHV